MDQGWVYVLVNSSLPRLVKVGCTTRSSAARAMEISAATGVPTPFVVAFDQAFADCMEAERLIHTELDRRGLRVAQNREFFHGAPSEIIRLIIEVAERDGPVSTVGPHPSSDRLRLAGDNALFGQGDTLQDTGEALRLYKLASARGSLLAFERIGQIYLMLYLASRDRPGRRRALSALKEGARRGNYYCYCELAVLFTADRNLANFAKAWDLFFTHRKTAPISDFEINNKRFAAACSRYLFQVMELGLVPTHHAELFADPHSVTAALLDQLDVARGNRHARHLLTAALRWLYEALNANHGSPQFVPRQAEPGLLPNWVSHQAIAPA